MKRQIGAQHSITIDINKELSLTGTETKPIRILVAEPDMDIRNLYYAYLDTLGFDVVTVESGNKCLEYAFDSTDDGYDMIMLDSHLHDIGGLEVAKNIRNRIPNQKIVLTTTYPLDQISNSLGSIGINQEDVMLKPFKFSTLLSVMKPKLAN
jgi:DNA-binding response OmpR family regulator